MIRRMMHVILMPDLILGREERRVAWDDEAGTVSGDHSSVPWLQEQLDEPAPLVLGAIFGSVALQDPRRRAEDFLALLNHACPSAQEQRGMRLPRALRRARPTPWDVAPLPPGAVA